MEIQTYSMLKKLQQLYSIMIITPPHSSESRYFLVDSYVPVQNQIPETTVVGKEITHLLTDSSLLFIAGSVIGEAEVNLSQRQTIETKFESLPSYIYKFSAHYSWELWQLK